jgi:hypothetical protein
MNLRQGGIMSGKTVIVTDASFEDDVLRADRPVLVVENPATANAYQVQSIPLMGLFSDGELVGSIVGARPKPAIMDELTKLLGS